MDSSPSSMSICVLVDISKNAMAYGKQEGMSTNRPYCGV
jgi:hypothetical protein